MRPRRCKWRTRPTQPGVAPWPASGHYTRCRPRQGVRPEAGARLEGAQAVEAGRQTCATRAIQCQAARGGWPYVFAKIGGRPVGMRRAHRALPSAKLPAFIKLLRRSSATSATMLAFAWLNLDGHPLEHNPGCPMV